MEVRWLNSIENAEAVLLHGNNTNPVKDEGRFIYSKAEKETSFLFLLDLDTEHVTPRISELTHKQTSKWNIAWIQKVTGFEKIVSS